MKIKHKVLAVAIMLVAIIIALLLSPIASKQPDGLEKVAEKLGFAEKAVNSFKINFIMNGYIFPGIKNSYWQTAFSGFMGVLFILSLFAFIYGIIFFTNKNKKNKKNTIQEEKTDSFNFKKF